MSERGWLAECQTCPTTTDPAYGHQVKVHKEFPADDELGAHLWALMHSSADLRAVHTVTVSRFQRFDVDLTDINPDVRKILTGQDQQS